MHLACDVAGWIFPPSPDWQRSVMGTLTAWGADQTGGWMLATSNVNSFLTSGSQAFGRRLVPSIGGGGHHFVGRLPRFFGTRYATKEVSRSWLGFNRFQDCRFLRSSLLSPVVWTRLFLTHWRVLLIVWKTPGPLVGGCPSIRQVQGRRFQIGLAPQAHGWRLALAGAGDALTAIVGILAASKLGCVQCVQSPQRMAKE